MEIKRPPFTKKQIDSLERSIISAPKDTSGYVLNPNMERTLQAMREANREYRASRSARRRVGR